MNTSRRAFLRTATAAAAVAPLATEVAALPHVTPGPPPVPPTPYNEHPWKWWVGHYEDEMREAFDTKEAALEVAKDEGYTYLAECFGQDYSLDVHGRDIIEILHGYNEDRLNEDGEFIDCTHEQRLDLGRMVTRALEEWVMKHNIDIQAWCFGGSRNQEHIPQDENDA